MDNRGAHQQWTQQPQMSATLQKNFQYGLYQSEDTMHIKHVFMDQTVLSIEKEDYKK